jgi:hypothetical protein
MKKMNIVVKRINVGLGIALLATLMGCVGYVDGGYGGGVVVAGPEVTLFGGGFERGRDVHAYSQRGGASRAAAHSGGGERGGKR